ncbi:MAG: hypothetical protein LBT36_05745 [Oscillospiraceae bacterium]|jgi:hypothetical protein|nr:hypothetical protein [Oscillospiraceae bacterium]
MRYSLRDFKSDVEEILNICDKELFGLSIGIKKQATKEQITGTIIPEMKQLPELEHNYRYELE